MLLTVVMGAYGALGFLVAAKGLVRIKELEELMNTNQALPRNRAASLGR